MFLFKLLQTPSSFKDDPWGYLRNQFLHAYLVGGGLILLGIPFAFVALLYLLWELAQYTLYKAELSDCMEDMGHVLLVAFAVMSQIWYLLPIHGLFLVSGFLSRKSL